MLVIFVLIAIPSILAATSGEIAKVLINSQDTESLEHTFKAFDKRDRGVTLSVALVQVAKEGYTPMVVTCLKLVQDSRPNDMLCVRSLVDRTLGYMFVGSSNSELTANVIASFSISDIKPLISIRLHTLNRNDIVDVMKSVMTKSTLIIDDLPNWLASHAFNRIAFAHNHTALEEAFQYLTFFATQSVLEKALSIINKNEHYKMNDKSVVRLLCCDSRAFPQCLFSRINSLLNLVKLRNALIVDILTFLPSVLVALLLDYVPNDTA